MTQKFEGLQLLRAVAATLVAGFHLWATASTQDPAYAGAFRAFRHGGAGVDLFFVLSGFIIYYTASGKRALGPGPFLRGRFFRVFPPYWVALFLYLFLVAGYAALSGDTAKLPGLQALTVSVLLLPYPDQIIVIAWTLTLEILFYCLFAATYFRFGRKGLFLTLAAWAAAGQGLRLALHPVPDALSLVFDSVVIEFLYGVVIANLVIAGRAPFRGPALILGAALMLAMLGGYLGLAGLPREFGAGLPAALVVYGLTAWQVPVPAALLLWGDASYILYLTHLLQFSVLDRAFRRLFGAAGYASDLTMAVMLAAVVVLSCLACLWLERPYQAWYHGRLRRRPVAA